MTARHFIEGRTVTVELPPQRFKVADSARQFMDSKLAALAPAPAAPSPRRLGVPAGL
jgi:hypothetical protein